VKLEHAKIGMAPPRTMATIRSYKLPRRPDCISARRICDLIRRATAPL
jgi:hypothetical protein